MLNKYMDWNRIYTRINDNAKARGTSAEYYETHHIVPRCLGGTNEADNLVRLTAREHYICHALLVKMHSGQTRHKMLYAFNAMRMNNQHQTRIVSRTYELFRIELQALKSQQMLENNPMDNAAHKAKHAEAMKIRIPVGMRGKTHSEETRQKMKAARAKQVITKETKRKLSEYNKANAQRPDYVNGERVGWYITPWGRFKSLTDAAENQPCTRMSIRRWCRINNTKTVKPNTVGQSILFSKDDIGKTFAELGFGFEELQ